MTRFIETDQGRVAYDVQGEGPVVLCIPGMGDTRAQYRHVVGGLAAAGHTVITMDVRGMGESDAVFADASPEAVGRDAVAVLRELDAADATVIGNSMAAASAVWAAAEAPERVSRIVLVGPFARDVPINPLMGLAFKALLGGPWGRLAWTGFYGSLLKAGKPADHADHVAALKKNLREPGRMATFRRMANASKDACAARMDEVDAKTLVIMGDADPDFPDPAAEARHLADVLHADVWIVPGGGHYPHQEVPEAFVSRVAAFVETPCRASA